MTVAHVPGFPDGVVKEGASDTQRTTELRECDSFDIGPRGALELASGLADYLTLRDIDATTMEKLHVLRTINGADYVFALFVGEGAQSGGGAQCYQFGIPARSGQASPYTIPGLPANIFAAPAAGGATPSPRAEGVIVTVAEFAGVHKMTDILNVPVLKNVFLVNIGAREGFAPSVAPGLYALYEDSLALRARGIDFHDALGTGANGEFAYDGGGAGTNAKQLRFRGICSHKTYAFGWGFDDTDATDKDGPTRVMFSNAAKPLKWGNDNIAASGDRLFSDTDAIIIGDLGEIVRAGISWNGRVWFGTNRQLHFIAGLGRDSWLTDGSSTVPRAENCIGAHCMIEGPDKLLYGVGEQGLWAFDGATFDRHHQRLRDFRQMSNGWWDLIWTDRSRADTYPGKTNADLCWMAVDWDAELVIVGIPWCSASNGYGYGTDTVLIKFNTKTKGFTRQVFEGVQLTAADFGRTVGQYPARKLLLEMAATPTSAMKVYGERTTPVTDIPLPNLAGNFPPVFDVGEYAFAGPNGSAVQNRVYLTLRWAAASALPIRFNVQRYIDGGLRSSHKLTIDDAAPGAPAEGDYWVDTSETDTNLGNASAGTLLGARGGFLLKTYRNAAWSLVPGDGVSRRGTRATIRLAFAPERGTRVSTKLTLEAASGRLQVESFGADPAPVTNAM